MTGRLPRIHPHHVSVLALALLVTAPALVPMGNADVDALLCKRDRDDHACEDWKTAITLESRYVWGSDAALTPDGSTLVLLADSGAGIELTALDAETGDTRWHVRYNVTSPGHHDDPRAVVVDDATAYVPARLGPWDAKYAAVLAFDLADGSLRWSANITDVDPLAAALVNGRLVVTGHGAGYHGAAVTAAFDAATGVEVWRHGYDRSGYDRGVVVAGAPGLVAVAMETWGGGSHGDVVIAGLDPATGAERWLARINTPLNDDEYAPHLAVSPDGARVGVLATSRLYGGDNTDTSYLTVVVDAVNGGVAWAATDTGARADVGAYPQAIAFSPDGGSVYVTGHMQEIYYTCCIGVRDALTIGYDAATGDVRWRAQLDSTTVPEAQKRTDEGHGIGVTPDGTRVLVGVRHDGAWGVAALDAATGEAVWWTRHAMNSYWVELSHLFLSPDGARALLVGVDSPPNSYDDVLAALAVPTADPPEDPVDILAEVSA